MFYCELVSDLEKSSPTYDIPFLKSLARMNRVIFHLMSCERMCAFAESKVDNLDSLKITVPTVQLLNEFVSPRCKYFKLAAFGQPRIPPHNSDDNLSLICKYALKDASLSKSTMFL
ncbi:E3 ubiquitin-protein ligase, putative [Medicago truncatula]|uniref:E3 ubiquitin-protein ligase, putative n=1 Tax=Medicago truncatula TaxID=3880 RepID=A0A072VKZ6_MEDTR|nr:E3 ubiquitin-protein ligase, putative [Medicago truncatula]